MMSDMDTMKNKRLIQTFGVILYLVGVVLASTILALSVWGEIEVITFDAAVRADERLRSLNCPVFITRGETGIITAVIENSTDRDVNPNVRSRISQGFVTLLEEEWKQVAIPANSNRQLQWEVTEENAAYDRLILTRIYQFRNFALPSRQAGCGIVVLPFSGPTGQQVFYASVIISSICMSIGLILFRRKYLDATTRNALSNIHRNRVIRAFIFLGIYLVVAALLSLIGEWLLGTILVVFAAISVLGVFSFFILSK